VNLLEVIIWDQLAGVIVWNDKTSSTAFEYSKAFIKQGFEISPLIHPLSSKIINSKADASYTSSESIEFDTNKGLPLFISDSLPDKFGTDLFAKYLEKEGKNYRNLTPLEKLAYIGNRGMGALEFRPNKLEQNPSQIIDLKKLNAVSKSVLNDQPIGNINEMVNLFHIGTSPGGTQPKVLININNKNGNIYRGDNLPTDDQDSWILKFNKDIGQEIDPYLGKIEYAYYVMAKQAKINMTESRLIKIDGEYFFMTQRFDRKPNEKSHTQTLHAFAGMNFKLPNTYSYEQIFSVLNTINLDYSDKEQLFRIMVFNIIARNVDDHTKNFGFNRTQNGEWKFSPAYDLTFSYNENYKRETPHFLSVNGKNENIKLRDILQVANEYSINNPKKIINEVNQSVLQWDGIAKKLDIPKPTRDFVTSKMRTLPYHITTALKK
jgi:serine/threonine-protein kinase HipA